MARYQASVVPQDIGHKCCNHAAVVDTESKSRWGGHLAICECWGVEEAIRIADALNARAMQEGN